MAVSKITNEHLDELVCGDVPPQRYREILTQLDAEPEKWRDCALAFLQEQAIESEMRQLSMDDANWEDETESERPFSAGNQATAVHVAPTSSRSETEKLRNLQRWTSIAASVLIAFSVGWVGSGFMGKSTSTTGVAVQEPSVVDSAGLADGSTAPDTRSSLRPDYSGVEATFANNESLVLDNEVPPELVRLERLGYRIESKSQLVPVDLKDGTRAIVPIKTYRALPPALPY